MTPRERYFNMGMRLSAVAGSMQANGWPIDPHARERHRLRLSKERDEAEIEFCALTGWTPTKKGKEFVSPCRQNKRLFQLFYGDFDVAPKKEYRSATTRELSVNANLLQDVTDEHPDPRARAIASALLKFRRAAKYLESFVENLPVLEDGRIHVPWNIYGARTMRWTAPTLHQLPKVQAITLPDGSKKVTREGLRDLCCAPPGYTIIESDKSQLELRLIAVLTGDPVLMDAYKKGLDVHAQNAEVLMGSRKGMAREVAKTFVFCDVYGGDPETSWKQMTPKFPSLQNPKGKQLVVQCSKKWRAAHPVIEKYKVDQEKFARENGYIPLPISGLRIEYHRGGTQGFKVDRTKVINTRVQHSGSDIMNPETVEVSAALDSKDGWIAAMVHDALILIVRDEVVPKTVEMLNKKMFTEVKYAGRTLPFPCEVKVGKNWATMFDYHKAELVNGEWRERPKV